MTRTNIPALRSLSHLQGAQTLTQSQPRKGASLRQHTGNTLLFLLLALLTVHINAQPAVPRPVFQSFQPINIPTEQVQTQQQFINQYLNNQTNVDPSIKEQNLSLMQQMGYQVPGVPSTSIAFKIISVCFSNLTPTAFQLQKQCIYQKHLFTTTQYLLKFLKE
jgi:hypothetical protein